MQFILSCAKTMAEKPIKVSNIHTLPIFKAEAHTSALMLQKYSVDQLKNILKCSDAIAVQNKKRYWNFFNEEELNQAVLSYTGVAYKSLNAGDFNVGDFEFAQRHMWITSFLYGLLRPMDLIHCYRLEGNVKLYDDMNMFEFWRPKLTDLLIDKVKNDDGVLIHIATEEMTHLFEWKKLKQEVDVIEPQFLVNDGKKLKIVTVYAKMCRGAMARYIIENRCENKMDLQNFEYEGFKFVDSVKEDNVEKYRFIM